MPSATDDTLAVAAAFRFLGIGADVSADGVVLADTGEHVSVHRGPVEAGGGPQILVRPHVSDDERQEWRRLGICWLDLGGYMSFRSDSVMVEAEVPGLAGSPTQRSTGVLTGRVVSGITMLALSQWPDPLPGMRATGRLIGSSPSAASRAIHRLIASDFLTGDRCATSKLFWRAAAEWRPRSVDLPLDLLPRSEPVLAVGRRAAALYGAPPGHPHSGHGVEFLIATPEALGRASVDAAARPLEADEPRARFAVAPAPVLFERLPPAGHLIDGVPVAAEPIAALAIAVNLQAGVEAVRAWRGEHIWTTAS